MFEKSGITKFVFHSTHARKLLAREDLDLPPRAHRSSQNRFEQEPLCLLIWAGFSHQTVVNDKRSLTSLALEIFTLRSRLKMRLYLVFFNLVPQRIFFPKKTGSPSSFHTGKSPGNDTGDRITVQSSEEKRKEEAKNNFQGRWIVDHRWSRPKNGKPTYNRKKLKDCITRTWLLRRKLKGSSHSFCCCKRYHKES